MIDTAIIVGTIVNLPTEKTRPSGSWTQCRLRLLMADGDPVFAYLSAFDPDARRALRPLGPGDMVALAGTVRFAACPADDGQPPLVLLTAHRIFLAVRKMPPQSARKTEILVSSPAGISGDEDF
jgi:hypothetical protein